MVLLTWTLFVLLNSYYAGTLTMFFATEANLPFKNLAGAIAKYPEWKMIAPRSSDRMYDRRRQADLDFNSYMEKMESESQPVFLDSMEEVYEGLKSPRNFWYGSEISLGLEQHKKLNGPDLTVVSVEDIYYAALAFPKYSPLTKVFSMGEGIIPLLMYRGLFNLLLCPRATPKKGLSYRQVLSNVI